MTSRIGKRTTAIFAFIALALSVIVPLSIPKAFSAPDCHRAEVGDYGAKIDKVVADFTAKIKKDGSYGYKIHNMRVYSSDLDSIVTGFGEGREIYEIIKKSKYSLEDILGEGAFWNGVSGAIRNEDGTTTSNGSFGIFSPKKTVDEAKLKEIITGELAEFLAKNPREICEESSDPKPGDNPKPGCHKAEISDYKEKIDQEVEKIEKSKRDNSYSWSGLLLNNIVPAFKVELELTDEQTEQVFGEGAIAVALGVPTIDDPSVPKVPTDHDWLRISRIHVDHATKFDREAMTKIVTDKVAEFLTKNPQEICEEEADPKPGTDEPSTEPTTGPTKPGTDEPTGPGDNPKPGDDTKPGDTAKPNTDTKPSETSKDGKTPAPDANNGGQAAPEGTDTNGDSQTVLEGATEAGGLATTGAVGLIALGVAALLVGVGAALAIRRRKQDM